MLKESFLDGRILVLDDERSNLLLLEKILRREGYTNIRSLTDPRELLRDFQEIRPDLILLDLMMPHLSGFEVMEQLKTKIPSNEFLPILVLTADATSRTKERALAGMATDFLIKPFDAVEVALRIRNLLWMRRFHLEQVRYERELEDMVRERTLELRNALADLRRTQQQVIQEERMRALGVMAGGVAHDLNNALSVILGFGELVLADCQLRPELTHDLEAMRAIVTAAQDAAHMVTRLREFNRPAVSEVRQPVDLCALARQAANLTEPRWKTQTRANGIIVDVVLATEKVPPILGDAAELREALTNLIFNAVDAMPNGGTIHLRCKSGSDRVVLEVSDTGVGMTEEVRQRCLEPFFSTKGDRGTGLGLAVVYGIIERHGGELAIDSEVGRGTTFRFTFAAAAEDASFVPTHEALAGEPLRILLVDEQEVFRDILRHFLEEDCHEVETAKSARDALSRCAAGTHDLVIANRTLPDMSGAHLVSEIKGRSPEQKVILLTGFGATEEAHETGGADLVLGKPISREGLRHGIAKVLMDHAPIMRPGAEGARHGTA